MLAPERGGDEAPILEIQDLVKHYAGGAGWFGSGPSVRAVDGLSLALQRGGSLGIVGESGCGKSTLAKLLVQLERPTSGAILFEGRDIGAARGPALHALRRAIQIVFQDPYTSLNGRMTAGAIIGEALDLHPTLRPKAERLGRIRDLLAVVGLTADHRNRYPHQFSGGQRQRIGIARALAVEPEVLVLDEPVSALDVSVQAQILNLLQDLRQQLGLSMILISHDLAVIAHASDHVAVMYLGKIVEVGSADAIYAHAAHPYTQALLSAALEPDRHRSGTKQRIVSSGDVPDPANPPSGCRFRTRCWKAQPLCAQAEPALLQHTRADLLSACHFAEERPGPETRTSC